MSIYLLKIYWKLYYENDKKNNILSITKTVLVMLSVENLTNVNNGMYCHTIQYVLLICVILSLKCDCVYTTKSDSVIMYCTFYNNVLH